jgi:threonine dehydrogenase-like Zn-dependent dehydrogenase
VRAAIFRNGEIVVDQMPEPKPGPGMVLVNRWPAASAAPTCTRASTPTAWSNWQNTFPGRKPMDLSRDVVFGHEFCCEVLDYGPGTTQKFKPGTKVCSLPALLTAEGPAGHRLLQRQYRRLRRAHAAQRSLAARSARTASRPSTPR